MKTHNKLFKPLLCAVLALLLPCLTFAACGDGTGTTSTGSVGNTSRENTSHPYGPVDYGEFPYEGRRYDTTIRIMCPTTSRHIYGEQQFVADPEKSGNVINDEVARRNNLIEEKYGIKFEIVAVDYPTDELEKYVGAGLDEIDIFVDSVDRMLKYVPQMYFLSLDDVMNINEPWWDSDVMENLAITDKHYFLAGDALLTDDDHIYCTLYNKKLYSENTSLSGKYGDLYQLVKDGKFTLDAFTEMSKAASHADSNGEWGFNATYGNLSHAYGATIMMNGCGIEMASKDSNTVLHINVDSTAAVTAFEKVFALMSDRHVTQRAELIIGQGSNPSTWGFSELQEMFVNGRGLFYNTTTSSISALKQSTAERDFDFGVLPIPKYDEAQEKYYCPVNRFQSSVIGIASTCTGAQLEATTFALQALGYYSGDVVRAYYVTTLQLQAVVEDKDAEMLDLIYNNRLYDLGSIFEWSNGAGGTFVNLYGSVINASTNTLMSTWQSMKPAVENAMQETIEKFQKLKA